MAWTLALDLVMTLLLAATIVATVMLNRRLNGLRDARSELESLADRFQASTSRADEGVAGLKVKAQSLQELIEGARSLSADLEFLIERGSAIADRLEADVRATRRSDPPRPDSAVLPAGRAEPRPITGGVAAASGAPAGLAARPAQPVTPAAASQRGRDAAQHRSEAERHLMAALRARA